MYLSFLVIFYAPWTASIHSSVNSLDHGSCAKYGVYKMVGEFHCLSNKLQAWFENKETYQDVGEGSPYD